MTGCSAVCGLSGRRQLRSQVFTSVSRSSVPCSTSDRTAIAATALLMLAAWNSVVACTAGPPGVVTP